MLQNSIRTQEFISLRQQTTAAQLQNAASTIHTSRSDNVSPFGLVRVVRKSKVSVTPCQLGRSLQREVCRWGTEYSQSEVMNLETGYRLGPLRLLSTLRITHCRYLPTYLVGGHLQTKVVLPDRK